jgi:hypothetical protein
MKLAANLSVVIQGPTVGADGEPLASVSQVLIAARRWLPSAEIILSTWRGGKVGAEWKPDQLVLSEDPGGMRYRAQHPFENNVNRQIRSTVAGLKCATRPYALKLRTDLLLTGTGFLEAFDQYPVRLPNQRVFRQRVVTCATYSVSPRHGGVALFHPSDWAHFGLTQDLLVLWDSPEAEPESLMRWFDQHPPDWEQLMSRCGKQRYWGRTAVLRDLQTRRELHAAGFACRYAPEQYLWIQALRRARYVGYQHALDFDPQMVADSEQWLVNNFIVLQAGQFGITSVKYQVDREERQTRLLTHFEWWQLYRQLTGDHGAASLRGGAFPALRSALGRWLERVSEGWNQTMRLIRQTIRRCCAP